jgi:hypothetical protein
MRPYRMQKKRLYAGYIQSIPEKQSTKFWYRFVQLNTETGYVNMGV